MKITCKQNENLPKQVKKVGQQFSRYGNKGQLNLHKDAQHHHNHA
jgi:hypothetical protein